MKEKIVIYGAGGHGKAIIDIIEKENRYQIIGLIDDHKPAHTEVFGYPILGNHRVLKALRQKNIHLSFVAIGDNKTRAAKTKLLTSAGFQLVVTVHPFSSIGREATLSSGSCVFHGAVIDPCAQIGHSW